jgi:hypothetical protein
VTESASRLARLTATKAVFAKGQDYNSDLIFKFARMCQEDPDSSSELIKRLAKEEDLYKRLCDLREARTDALSKSLSSCESALDALSSSMVSMETKLMSRPDALGGMPTAGGEGRIIIICSVSSTLRRVFTIELDTKTLETKVLLPDLKAFPLETPRSAIASLLVEQLAGTEAIIVPHYLDKDINVVDGNGNGRSGTFPPSFLFPKGANYGLPLPERIKNTALTRLDVPVQPAIYLDVNLAAPCSSSGAVILCKG